MVVGPGGSVAVVTAGTAVGAGEQPRVSVALSFAGTARRRTGLVTKNRFLMAGHQLPSRMQIGDF